jgi:hypothetical protein
MCDWRPRWQRWNRPTKRPTRKNRSARPFNENGGFLSSRRGSRESGGGRFENLTGSDGAPAPADRSPARTAATKQLFHSAGREIAKQGDDDPQPERRRKKEGESDTGMLQIARQFSRVFGDRSPRAIGLTGVQDTRAAFHDQRATITRQATPDDDAFATATAFLSDTLDSMNPFWPPFAADIADVVDGDFGTQQNQVFPQP